MLSIGKLVAGQARYYLDPVEGRVDAVESVGEGAEEYYLGGSEAYGTWVGTGSARLGLDGPVEASALRSVLAGLDPRDGSALRSGKGGVRVAAFDLTFSAPKSASLLFGLGEPDVQDAVRRAHDRAVGEALTYMERSAAFVRRGTGGVEVMPADGLVAAAFRHRTSRAGDPQLHTHVVAANLARGADGRWSALDGRRLYAHARTASFVYQAVLRGELTRMLGVEWTPVRRGVAEIANVPPDAIRAFSRRRVEIEAALDARRTTGGRAAEAAALATRRPKDHGVAADALAAQWRARGAALGLDHTAVRALTGRTPAPALDAHVWVRILDELLAPDGLTHRRPTFSRRDVMRALAERVPPGATIDADGLDRAADRLLRSTRVVPVAAQPVESIRRRDGRTVRVARGDLAYSTVEQLALEQHVVDRAIAGRADNAAVVPAPTVAAAMRSRPTLSGEQRAMVESLCRDGSRVAIVAGRAGTGKTFALATAREAWEAAGHPVLGAAVARRAAQELEQGAGIPGTSVAALVHLLGDRRLPTGCVLVVDEAGMVPTRQLAALLDHVERADGKLVLVGDEHQLPELEAGGAFHGLVRRGLAVELTENRRQSAGWERNALEQLREGRAAEAVAAYEAHDRIRVEPGGDQVRAVLVRDWWAAGDLDGAVMIAHRRADVADLNRRARELLGQAGALGPEELRLPGGAFAVGDLVVVRRNDLARGVHNGDRARVVAIDPARTALTIDSRGRRVTLAADFLLAQTAHGEPALRHGYAITAHVAQGCTVDRAYVLAGESLSREWAYTAMSRGRHHNALYLAEADQCRDEFAPRETHPRPARDRLIAALERTEASSLAIDSGRATESRTEPVIVRTRQALEAARARRAAHEFDRAEGRER